ncbi:uncharacterized protein LOC105704100 [Orussus abietinus]|uniref:uncharacterized protein LOC105704100 n=1 Tax=Orussus abietinus TaxID=222816 RepID=UPI00062551FC|nr:uncharacterized protein LOC105704100 [Orussus abietinus]
MIGKILVGFWLLRWIGLLADPAAAQGWPTPLQESLDEKNDAEIFKAVVESMREWETHRKYSHRTKREVSRVCYEDVGCFEDTGPFSYLERLPSPPKDVGTRFLVYGSRKARSIPMEVPADDINDNAHRAIDPDLPTKVIVHGFGSGCEHVWVYEMRSALMSVQECNIVCVDWGPGSAMPNYVRAAANTRLVGRQLAKLVRNLNVPLDKVHLIGFSLGAHVAGFAGAELGNVSRITGLDPAGPLFESQDPKARLDASDARFVDVIHSNGEQLILGGLGSWQPMGHVDFYPNGGRMQTGCSNLFLGAVSDIIWSSAVEGRSLCNHRRAYKFFTDSVSPKCRFPAFPCDHGYDGLLRGDCFPCGVNGANKQCGDMGYYSDVSPGRGQLYLVTRDEEPFCAHQYQVKVYNSRGERPARSYGKLQLTLVGESSFNETFTMTRKDDEELLVGAILHKIVVPHPAILNLEAIEIKYTAYSGWISSGLVSWSIDKVGIVDSFGKSLSICKRGLTLESGRSVYLRLYPGECNIPPEPETQFPETSQKPFLVEQFAQDKQGGIGPFTKEQNYEKGSYKMEVIPSEIAQPEKGLGPFTKDQNPVFDEDFQPQNIFGNVQIFSGGSEGGQSSGNPWSVADLNDGASNSLENVEGEKGRGFSNPRFSRKSSTIGSPKSTSTTDGSKDIQEPVLQKKETGRSLRLPEITEPVLRPRGSRQNPSPQDSGKILKIQDPDPFPRGFTVQFLPERLAGILAQAERYARQTLLPLISQYTPSFVGGTRRDEPKYFPPLGDIAEVTLEDVTKGSRERVTTEKSGKSGNGRGEDAASQRKAKNQDNGPVFMGSKDSSGSDGSSGVQNTTAMVVELSTSSSGTSSVNNQGDEDWVPVSRKTIIVPENLKTSKPTSTQSPSIIKESTTLKAKYESKWLSEGDGGWSSQPEEQDAVLETKISDWAPVTDKSPVDLEDQPTSSATQTEKSEEMPMKKPEVSTVGPGREIIIPLTGAEVKKSNDDTLKTRHGKNSTGRDERKYIPLVDFEHPDEFFASTVDKVDTEHSKQDLSTSTETVSHIQKIPTTAGSKSTTKSQPVMRTIVFPYAYEKQKDPRTRYIPLIPEEDMGKPFSDTERDR